MVSQLMPLIGGFIGLIIILGIGSMILGNSTMNCTTLSGYGGGGAHKSPTDPTIVQSSAADANSTGWAKQCVANNTNAQSGYALLLVSVIVFAAVIILSIVRLLG